MTYRRRVFAILIGFVVIAALTGGRLAMLQLGAHDGLAAATLAQNSIEVPLEDYPRGRILDRYGQSLTAFYSAERIVVIPHYISEPAQLAATLGCILEVDVTEINPRLDVPGVLPYPLSPAQSIAVRGLRSRGLIVCPVTLRYGDQALAPHITGHLGKIHSDDEWKELRSKSGKPYRIDDWVGKTGIEAVYERYLRGERPTMLVRTHRDAAGRPLPGLDMLVEQDDYRRADVILTLDARIQQIAEEVLTENTARGAMVVSDVRTGDIVAAASYPRFSARDPFAPTVDEGSGEVFFDRTLALYQPGSIFKIVVAAAAIEAGVASLETSFVCNGKADRLITCWNAEGHGEINFAKAFAVSCNPFFANLGLAVGAETLADYAVRLGLSEQTIIGYPYEPDARQDFDLIKRPYNLVNASVGQGPVLVSPVQVNALVAAIANDGLYHTPRLVDRVQRSDGEVLLEFPVAEPQPVMKSTTAQLMRQLMELVTEDGQGALAYLSEGGSAGKTGSAETGTTGKINAWFAGYFPLVSPRYAITILVEDGVSGGVSAAPLFGEIALRIQQIEVQ
ncbi:MAG: penicillin-binding protein 2 [Clostridia bacterium]|nr:penicillin-binding protein 2 [Clostridia bacterium]MDQ7790852.1 penicillin-binding protein 2 [Clostridia bacterium]